jgi:hypothetical protein
MEERLRSEERDQSKGVPLKEQGRSSNTLKEMKRTRWQVKIGTDGMGWDYRRG